MKNLGRAALFATIVTCGWMPQASAVTSSESVFSPFGGNGHNVSFDGRLFIIRRGPDGPTGGWFATILRPDNIAFRANGLPDFDQGAFSPMTLIQPVESGENALAICQPAVTPYACNDAGDPTAAGPYACYDVEILDSNALQPDARMRRRALTLWVENPETRGGCSATRTSTVSTRSASARCAPLMGPSTVQMTCFAAHIRGSFRTVRASYLDASHRGDAPESRFGPLQLSPLLPP